MSRDIRNLLIALAVGLVHGLVYINLIPPWQHYDEPNHFEYVWLISNRGKLPTVNDIDFTMRTETAESMIDHGFFRNLGFLPALGDTNRPAWIGAYSQLANPPLFYLAAAFPVYLAQDMDMANQLLVVRYVSLGFYLLTLLAAWGIIKEITPVKHPLRFYLPVTLALLPGFTDLMTAANNDVAAIALLSLSLWGCVHLIVRGARIFPLIVTTILTILCLFSKETAYVALILFLITILFVLFGEKNRRIAWTLLGAGTAIGLVLVVSSGDASGWYRSTAQASTTRSANPQAVLGDYVFSIDGSSGNTPHWSASLFQPVLVSSEQSQADKSYTVGAWIWAEFPDEVNAPILGNGQKKVLRRVEVGTEPSFYAYSAESPEGNGERIWVGLDPEPILQHNQIFYDGLVLLNSAISSELPPVFSDEQGTAGVWGGEPFANLLRNGSAEGMGLRVSPWLDDIGARIMPDNTRPAAILTYLLDWKDVLWHYRLTAGRLFRTFWAEFGWGHVPLLGHKPYRVLLIVSSAGLIGFVYWFFRRIARRNALHWEIIYLLGVMMLVVWGGAISRGVLYLGQIRLYLPVARYAYPAIIPTLLVLCIGWQLLFTWLYRWQRTTNLAPYLQMTLWLGALIILDLYSIFSIVSYYGAVG